MKTIEEYFQEHAGEIVEKDGVRGKIIGYNIEKYVLIMLILSDIKGWTDKSEKDIIKGYHIAEKGYVYFGIDRLKLELGWYPVIVEVPDTMFWNGKEWTRPAYEDSKFIRVTGARIDTKK